MYITDTTDNVKKLFENLEDFDDISKIKFILYVFNLLNNNLINEKNETNPNLMDDNLNVFNMELLGMSNNACTIFLQYNIMLFNNLTKSNSLLEDNGNVIGLKFNEKEKRVIKLFDSLEYNEKLDVFKELFITYDNNTFFKKNINILSFSSSMSGFDIANLIDKFKCN